jgi:hypothetical protein
MLATAMWGPTLIVQLDDRTSALPTYESSSTGGLGDLEHVLGDAEGLLDPSADM